MLVAVVSVGLTKVNEVPSIVVLKTVPADIVAVALVVVRATSTVAVAARGDCGTYPDMFHNRGT